MQGRLDEGDSLADFVALFLGEVFLLRLGEDREEKNHAVFNGLEVEDPIRPALASARSWGSEANFAEATRSGNNDAGHGVYKDHALKHVHIGVVEAQLRPKCSERLDLDE
ncbi:hypothetical protein [Paludisphaera rhizosphaerae]|uniref:hypothetical protein n=1 Tax=Paludisphaera rhizosphaerae TaxID=2711216 RepID=UPI0013EDB287|nr:hypothetical protein [Paludisphaera rhizosphaerae]